MASMENSEIKHTKTAIQNLYDTSYKQRGA